jgi:hypothetical protein
MPLFRFPVEGLTLLAIDDYSVGVAGNGVYGHSCAFGDSHAESKFYGYNSASLRRIFFKELPMPTRLAQQDDENLQTSRVFKTREVSGIGIL